MLLWELWTPNVFRDGAQRQLPFGPFLGGSELEQGSKEHLLLSMVGKGFKTLGQPSGCSSRIREMMFECLKQVPCERPNFDSLSKSLRLIVEEDTALRVRSRHSQVAVDSGVDKRQGVLLSRHNAETSAATSLGLLSVTGAVGEADEHRGSMGAFGGCYLL